jgi:pimeloyl-ACP methyl ester carboxylesterase
MIVRPLSTTCSTSKLSATPVAFGGCFGWLHPAVEAGPHDTAILLCGGLGRDAIDGYRSFLVLGTRLAMAGYPTLRFDYPGTGDSCETSAQERWQAWLDSIQAAADWLRANTGARSVVLIGLRLGATLAALAAAARDDVAGLALLEPVLRGKSYVSQLLTEARLRGNGAVAPDDGVAVDELSLSGETLRVMSGVDLRQTRLPAAYPVAVFSQYPSQLLSTCIEAWQKQGVPVTIGDFTALEAFLRPSHLADEPPADVTPILGWLEAAVAVRPLSRALMAPPPEAAMLTPTGCLETPVRFGTLGHLFGMLCQPARDLGCDQAVIIGNTGGDPHHGYARFAVEFARRLAVAGIASLRLDFAGLGDSFGPSGDFGSPTQVFGIDRSPDISAAVDMLQAIGYRRFVANGLCSGAYHALQGALADERITALLLINLPMFTLRHDRAGPASATRRSMATLSDRRVSTLLLFAEGDPGLLGLEKHFGPGGHELADTPSVVVSILAGLDHNLTSNAIRRLAADSMIDFLRHGPSASEVAEASVEAPLHTARKESKVLTNPLFI